MLPVEIEWVPGISLYYFFQLHVSLQLSPKKGLIFKKSKKIIFIPIKTFLSILEIKFFNKV